MHGQLGYATDLAGRALKLCTAAVSIPFTLPDLWTSVDVHDMLEL